MQSLKLFFADIGEIVAEKFDTQKVACKEWVEEFIFLLPTTTTEIIETFTLHP